MKSNCLLKKLKMKIIAEKKAKKSILLILYGDKGKIDWQSPDEDSMLQKAIFKQT
jgi:hypothetical protein